MVLEFIKKLQKQTVVSIFCDPTNPSKHLTGWICASSDDVVMIQHISPHGMYDGYILVQSDDIYRIDVEGEYEKKMYILYTNKRQNHPNVLIEENIYSSLLDFCKSEHLVISVELEDSTLTGFVTAFDDEHIALALLDDYGNSNGQTVIMNRLVISFAVDTEKEQDIKLLHEQKQNRTTILL